MDESQLRDSCRESIKWRKVEINLGRVNGGRIGGGGKKSRAESRFCTRRKTKRTKGIRDDKKKRGVGGSPKERGRSKGKTKKKALSLDREGASTKKGSKQWRKEQGI